MSTFIVGLAAALIMAQAADVPQQPDQCPAPQVPAQSRVEKPQRPKAPACVDEARRRHTCTNRVIGAYEAELERYDAAFGSYMDSIGRYVEALNAYVMAVNNYVECERKIIMPDGPLIRS